MPIFLVTRDRMVRKLDNQMEVELSYEGEGEGVRSVEEVSGVSETASDDEAPESSKGKTLLANYDLTDTSSSHWRKLEDQPDGKAFVAMKVGSDKGKLRKEKKYICIFLRINIKTFFK